VRIIAENGKVWNSTPIYLLEYKRHHPDDPIDPDMPPAREIVKAIRFLRQHHLAGNLLGEWQMPLPPAKVCRPLKDELYNRNMLLIP